jgi:hypothetical protein
MITSTEIEMWRNGFDFYFTVLVDDYFERSSQGQAILRLIREVFAPGLKERGAVFDFFSSARPDQQRRVLEKEWPEDALATLVSPEPKLLLTDRLLANFNPAEHRYAFVHLPADEQSALTSLRDLAVMIAHGDDPFVFMKQRADDEPSLWRRVFHAVEAKPGAFGFAIDLKDLFR